LHNIDIHRVVIRCHLRRLQRWPRLLQPSV